jgi:hypothetical protein
MHMKRFCCISCWRCDHAHLLCKSRQWFLWDNPTLTTISSSTLTESGFLLFSYCKTYNLFLETFQFIVNCFPSQKWSIRKFSFEFTTALTCKILTLILWGKSAENNSWRFLRDRNKKITSGRTSLDFSTNFSWSNQGRLDGLSMQNAKLILYTISK